MNVGILGGRRSGKTSIIKLVFSKHTANETMFLEPTQRLEEHRIRNNPHLQYKIIEFPGNFSLALASPHNQSVLHSLALLIFVVDAQDQPHSTALDTFSALMKSVHSSNPRCLFEVFIHKVDGDMFANEDEKLGIQSKISASLRSQNVVPEPSYHLTSIYDLSIFESLSKVIQKVTPQVPFLQKLLDGLAENCNMRKVYLMDVMTKLYIASDSNPADSVSYELCSDVIDVVIDMSCIYGFEQNQQDYNEVFDRKSTSMIKLERGVNLCLREIHQMIALVCIVKEDEFERQGLIEYNIDCFRQGAQKILETS